MDSTRQCFNRLLIRAEYKSSWEEQDQKFEEMSQKEKRNKAKLIIKEEEDGG